MQLFEDLTPEVQQLIQENTVLINKHLAQWIRNEKKVQAGMWTSVLDLISLSKRRLGMNSGTLSRTEKRKRMINRLIQSGHDMPQFRAVVDYKVKTWYGTEMQSNLTPETLFSPDNFTKYLEQAREAYLESQKDSKPKETKSDTSGDPYNSMMA